MIRIAAVGDVHFGEDSAGRLRPQLQHLAERADVFLLAGDLTRHGEPVEAKVLADELRDLDVPTVAVLGNHDHHAGCPEEVTALLEDAGVRVLEAETLTLEVAGRRLGIAGAKGFGGGFQGACASDFGEPMMKEFIGHTRDAARGLEDALCSLEADLRVALLHYAPVEGTLQGERLEIYPFLGSYLLGEAVDRAGADLVVHGHAHAGAEKAATPGGIPVRNVAQPLLRRAYAVFCFAADGEIGCEDTTGP